MRRFCSAVALVVVSISLTIALFELLLTVLSQWLYPRLIVSDSDLGWKYEPSRSIERVVQISDVISKTEPRRVTTNSFGFRDQEFRNDADLRIMLLGDSMTFGLDAGDEEILARKLETIISRRIGKTVDVMNFGVTGFSTAQEFFALTKFAPLVRPQVVIMVLWAENDFEDNAVYFSAGRYRPHFSITNDELTYVNRPSPLERALQFAKENTILFTFVDNRFPIYEKNTTIEWKKKRIY